MPWPVTINGKTYTLDSFSPYNYTTNFPKICQDIADVGAAAAAVMAGANYGNSFRNRLINSTFLVNQLALTGTITLAGGAYGHDGWKAGANGCSYVVGRSGGITTITGVGSAANTLAQVIEGPLSLQEGGTFTLSWGGTAQARVNGGAYAASPITVTGLTPDANATIELDISNGKTFWLPMFEPGNKRTVFEYRDDELRRCQRYFFSTYQPGTPPGYANVPAAIEKIAVQSSYTEAAVIALPVSMYANPTVTIYSPKTGASGKVYRSYDTTGAAAADVPAYVKSLTNQIVGIGVAGAVTSNGDFIQTQFTAAARL